MKTKKIIRKIVLSSIFSALIFITAFFLKIPFANGNGYLNFADVFVLVLTYLEGPIAGSISAIIGLSMADLASGYAFFIPFTIVARLLECFSLFLINRLIKNQKLFFISFLIAPLFIIIIYYFSYIILYSFELANISILLDMIQAIVSSILSIILILIYKKIRLK